MTMIIKSRIWIYPFAIMSILIFLTSSCKKNFIIAPETVTDIDGNVYHTVVIGTQVWLVENLKTTRYNNGDSITKLSGQSQWTSIARGAYCDKNNDPNFSETYGRLYNWYAVNDTRKLAPTGWHVPTDIEWTGLVNREGGLLVAGGYLKESGLLHWPNPNVGADNRSGFTALPSGYRDDLGEFNPLASGYWWSSTETGFGAWSYNMSYVSAGIVRADAGQNYGYAVRCIKD
jgi:uncharacterized protein (TIGR02145 family)